MLLVCMCARVLETQYVIIDNCLVGIRCVQERRDTQYFKWGASDWDYVCAREKGHTIFQVGCIRLGLCVCKREGTHNIDWD